MVDFDKLSDDELRRVFKAAKKLDEVKETTKLLDWNPIPKQWEYLNSQAKIKALIACNQGGKTASAMFEESSHATGVYHKNWRGVRYKQPVDIWVVGETSMRVRDTLQEKLFGPIGRFGTGMIPKDNIVELIMKPGIPGAIDRAYIRHNPTGGISSIQFFSFEMGREKFQGSTIDRVVFDEEPPHEIYGECKMRLIVKDGIMTFTFTPLSGITELYSALMDDETVEKFSIAMDDLPWMTEEKIERMLAGLSEHEKNARRYGIAASAAGRIFQFQEEQYTCESFEIPKHWPRIGGLDIGLNHPTCAVAAAWDRDADCVYIYQEYKKKGATPPEHAMTLKHWGVQFALSHDAFNRSSQTGKTTADVYKEEGLKVFNAGKDPWMRIEKCRSMIASGRLWIFKDRCPELVREMRTYRTKEDGRTIVKVDDDQVDSMTHAVAFVEKAEVLGREKQVTISIEEWKPSGSYGY